MQDVSGVTAQDIVMQEAMIMRQQRHENVLPLLAAFLSEAVLWMVMPYVAGGSVTHILSKKCPAVSLRCLLTFGRVFECSHIHYHGIILAQP